MDLLKLKLMSKKGKIALLKMHIEVVEGQQKAVNQGKFVVKNNNTASHRMMEDQYEMKGRRSKMHNSIDSNDGVMMTEEEIQQRPPAVLPHKKINVPQLKLTLTNHQ